VDLSDTTETQGVLPLSRGGTGNSLSPVVGAIAYSSNDRLNLTPTSGNAGDVLVSGGGVAPPFWQAPIGGGTVTSINASGGTTGLSFTGGPITTFGTLTLGGTLAVANGGTGATTAAAARTNLGAAASGANTDITSIALTTGTVSASPVNGTDIVNKVYADSIASGINFHQSVRLATAAALPANTYNNGASGVGATLTANANAALSVDGVAAVVGNRILVKNEVAQANNGVYTVTQVGSGAAPYILTRATDFDSAGTGVDQIDAGDFFLVTAGSTQSNTSWVQQTPLPITVGTTALVFTQFAAPVLYSAGTGLTLAGTVFSLTAPVTVALGGTGATSLSSGYLVKGNDTSAVSASVVYDNGTNVGIGTASPSGKLQINGNFLRIDQSGSNAAFLGNAADLITGAPAGAGLRFDGTALRISASSTEIAQFTSGGNLGIGVSSPTFRLQVETNSDANAGAFIRNSNTGTAASGNLTVASAVGNIFMRAHSAANSVWPNSTLISSDSGFTGGLNFAQAGANPIRLWTNGTERMRITDAGNAGIGTTTPLSRLDVREANRADSTNITNVGIYTTTAQATGVGGTLALGGLFNVTGFAPFGSIRGGKENSTNDNYAGYLAFQTIANAGALTEKMRITSAGNVGIGTTTPGALLDVNGNATVRGNTTLGDAVGDLATIPDQLALEYTTDSLPTTRPALSLDFVDVGALDPRVTFTRASTATFTGSNGLIQTAAINAPRFDYDPVTLAPKGLLIEEARTNLLTYSEQFDNAAWTKSSSSVSANATIAPDGTLTADKLQVLDALNTQKFVNQIIGAISTTYADTVYAKASELSWLIINQYDGSDRRTWFNLSNGTVGTTAAGTTATIEVMANGWYRCRAIRTVGTGSIQLVLNVTNADNVAVFTGTVGQGIFIWGAQREAGAFATSYIPTVASTVTRSADVASMTGANFSNWYNQSAGTFVFQGTVLGASGFSWPLVASDNTAANRFSMYRSGSTVAGFISAASVTQMEIASLPVAANVLFKIAVTAQANSGNFSFNGNIGSIDTTITMPVVNRLSIGSSASGAAEYLNGHIQSIQYYNTRFPNDVLQGVTR
jgi:hypothetical protein